MKLNELRKNIDEIDAKIVELINERYKHVLEVGKWKQNTMSPIYVPEREKSLLERLCKLNQGPMHEKTLRAIYHEIMSGAFALERPLKVAYLGPEATYTHQAAMAKFGHSVEYTSRNSIADVFSDVETGRADYGCVPVENSTEGAVSHTLDKFIASPACICAEIRFSVRHNLMAKCPREQIKRIYSHAQSLGQCRAWLLQHMPGVELIEINSNSRAAQQAASEEHSAAIAGKLAAELYGLEIIESDIQDSSDNTTRFLVLAKQQPAQTGDDKTSICFAAKDRVGILYDCLLPFKEQNIMMTFIESRPSKQRNWEYYFFIDFLGHQGDKKVKEALTRLSELCHFVKVLGSYPRTDFTH
jgi:chorismate mutase/prephenate dehydratase